MKTFEELKRLVGKEVMQKLAEYDNDEAEILIEHILQADSVTILGYEWRMSYVASAVLHSLKETGINAKDYGMCDKASGTLVLILSATGEEPDLITMMHRILGGEATVLALTPNSESTVAGLAHTHVSIPSTLIAEGVDESIQPGTRLTEQSALLYFDVISMQLKSALGN